MSPAANLTLAPSFVCTITPATPPQSPSKPSFHNPTPPSSPPASQTTFNPHRNQFLSPPPGRPGGPKLSLDTSQERLKYTVVNHEGQNYLKLFSPVLVESPVSFLSPCQLFDDKKLWENGPDGVLEKKIDMERREVFKGMVRFFMRNTPSGASAFSTIITWV